MSDFECCRNQQRREQWQFTGRENHWGYTFLAWTLTSNPAGKHEIGKRWVRWVR